MSKKLYVGNLAWGVTEDQLRDHFSSQGTVDDVKIITDRETGKSRGFGFVTMASNEDGDKAIAAMHDQDFSGRKLTVNEARERERTGAPQGGRQGGFSDRGHGGGSRGGYRERS